MSIDIKPERMVGVAKLAEGQCTAAEGMRTSLNSMGTNLDVWAWSNAARTALAEFVEDASNAANVLTIRAEMATIADGGSYSDARYSHLQSELDNALAELRSGLDDGVGATGSPDDLQDHLERTHFGVGDLPEMPDDVEDPAAWHAANITGPVLDGSTPAEVTRYWDQLSEEERYAAIIHATPSVSDAYQADTIVLDENQVFALQSMPLGVWDRGPSSGASTDWAGVDLPPLPADAVETGVQRDELRSFAGGSVICSAIQVFSPIPSRPDLTTGPRGAASAAGIGNDVNTVYQVVRNGTSAGKAINPATWVAAAADIGLCRLGVGSADPISSDKILDDDGNMVFETSRSEVTPNAYPEGVTVSPNAEQRDVDRWNREHLPPNGTWETYPGFPAYPENDPANWGD